MSRRRRARREVAAIPELARPAARVPRRVRVEGELQHALSSALSRMEDPRLAGMGVTRVLMSDDLQVARVYVRLAYGGEATGVRADAMRAMAAAAGRLRQHAGRHLALRYTPLLRFVYDDGPDAAQRVEELLAEIHREPEGASE